jgi:hypothetical protein
VSLAILVNQFHGWDVAEWLLNDTEGFAEDMPEAVIT